MDDIKKTTSHPSFIPIILFVLIAIGFLLFSLNTVRNGAGTTKSKATADVTLTPGDDALSLQQDLNSLGTDPGAVDQQQLDSFNQ